MGRRTTLTVSLTPEWEEFIDERVRSGRYLSASEVVREGLRQLAEREREHTAELDRLRTQVRLGLEQARAGDLLDGDEVFESLAARRRASATP
jgi:antitoxin ParD1/3/4